MINLLYKWCWWRKQGRLNSPRKASNPGCDETAHWINSCVLDNLSLWKTWKWKILLPPMRSQFWR
jgi:hypothetical protein